jgi:hypothetical protein
LDFVSHYILHSHTGSPENPFGSFGRQQSLRPTSRAFGPFHILAYYQIRGSEASVRIRPRHSGVWGLSWLPTASETREVVT